MTSENDDPLGRYPDIPACANMQELEIGKNPRPQGPICEATE
jgi:hypothetical protein